MFDENCITDLISHTEGLVREVEETVVPNAVLVSSAARKVGDSWSGSALGHHSSLYYANFQTPPFHNAFDSEWGTIDGMPPGWCSRPIADVLAEIRRLSNIDLDDWQGTWESLQSKLENVRESLLVEFGALNDPQLKGVNHLLSELKGLRLDALLRQEMALATINAHRASMSRDLRALSASGVQIPGHIFYDSLAEEVLIEAKNAAKLSTLSHRIIRTLLLTTQSNSNQLQVKGELPMLQDLANNPFVLKKQDGQELSFLGVLSKSSILTFNSKLLVEEGDSVERTLPSGVVERYFILDPGFNSGLRQIGPFYNMKVQRQSTIPPKQLPLAHGITNIYNVQGPNARINLHANDQSQNVANVGEIELFEKLRKAIELGVSDSTEKATLLEAAADLEQANGTSSFATKFQQLLSGAANCMTVLTPFLPALSQLVVSAHHT